MARAALPPAARTAARTTVYRNSRDRDRQGMNLCLPMHPPASSRTLCSELLLMTRGRRAVYSPPIGPRRPRPPSRTVVNSTRGRPGQVRLPRGRPRLDSQPVLRVALGSATGLAGLATLGGVAGLAGLATLGGVARFAGLATLGGVARLAGLATLGGVARFAGLATLEGVTGFAGLASLGSLAGFGSLASSSFTRTTRHSWC